MIKARMTDLNYNEILMYLGHRGQEVTPEVDAQIKKCMADVQRYAVPRLVYSRLPVKDGAIVGFPAECAAQKPAGAETAGDTAEADAASGAGLGADIREILLPCREAVLLAVTLGAGMEQEILRREVTDMAEALILDACASVAAENVCDRFEESLRAELAEEGLYLTSRFSPGYGDFPIEYQRELCEVLNTARRIGLTVTDSCIMVPRKSVTAVMGIAEEPQELRKRGCEACSLFLHCTYRKRGINCE